MEKRTLFPASRPFAVRMNRRRALLLMIGSLLVPLGCESPADVTVDVKTEEVHVIGVGPSAMDRVILEAEREGGPRVRLGSWSVDRADGHFEFTAEVDGELCSGLQIHGWWSGSFVGIPWIETTQRHDLGRCGEHDIVLIEDD